MRAGRRSPRRRWCCSATQTSSPATGPRRSRWMTPSLSATTTCAAPAASSTVRIAMPAAPAPDITMRTSLDALADDLQGVDAARPAPRSRYRAGRRGRPGCRGLSRSRRSISKQRGAEMSSRLMPAKTGAISSTARTISSTSWVSRQIGKASMPAKRLNSAALPSITGSAGDRADVAQTEHRGAVGDDGDGVALDGQPPRVLRVLGDAPGRPGPRRACRSSTGRRGCGSAPWAGSRSCRRGARGRCGRRPCRWSRRRRRPSASVSRWAWAVSLAAQVTSIGSRSWPERRDVERGDHAAGLLDRVGQLADRVAACGHLESHGDRVGDAGQGRHGIVRSSQTPA